MAYTTEELRQIGKEWVEDWANHRSAKAMELFAQDVKYIGPNRTFQGYDKVIAFVNGFFKSYPDEKWQFRKAYADADTQTLIIEWRDTATMKAPWPLPSGAVLQPTGRRYDYIGCDILSFNEEGKVYNWQEYFDMMIMMQQLGIAKEYVDAGGAIVVEDTAENMLSTVEEGDKLELE